MEDAEIVDLFFQRSEQAIPETAAKYQGLIFQISRNILENPQDAEECVNDTYLHTWNAIPPARPSALKLWLGRIARNLSLDRWKWTRAQKRGGAGMEVLLGELDDCVPTSHSPERCLEDQEIADLIGAFLRRLPAERRQIFLRRYWYGQELSEIAGALGCGQGKVKSSLFRTRKALRAYLEQEGVAL